MVTFLSLLVGKLIMKLLRASGRTGSALPGLVVEKLHPNVLQTILGQLPYGVIIVSGTNGKTTTTKILTSLLEAQGLRVLTNKTGSNFVRGIISVLVEYARVDGKLEYDIAVFEQDEAYAVRLARKIKPRGVVALNVMRDQMDRFGEIDTTTKMLQKLVVAATDWVVLNANDERISTLKPRDSAQTFWYGYSPELLKDFLSDDQLYEADSAKYFVANELTTELMKYGDGTVTIRSDVTSTYDFALGGSHNAINITAALAALNAILPDMGKTKIKKAVANLEPAFGRGESFSLHNGVEVTLQLVKNPAGFMHALRMVTLKKYAVVGIAINDDYADGRDVSWLWDVDFSILQHKAITKVTGGTRAADMAVRLKYDEVGVAQNIPDLKEFIQETTRFASNTKGSVIIFCTYTAMLELRRIYKNFSSEVYEVEV